MNIWIDISAIRGGSDRLLEKGALFGMKYLIQSGHELSFEKSGFSAAQKELMSNEDIISSGFSRQEADAVILKTEDNLFSLENRKQTSATGKDWFELSRAILFPHRKASVRRKTNETDIETSVNLDGSGTADISTGLKFFDHMLDQLSKHGLIDIELRCKGDLDVDEHHTIEDTAIALGKVLDKAVNRDKTGIQRYGFYLPMDEARATVGIDLSARPYLRWDVEFTREYIGDFPTEMAEHFFHTLAMNLNATVHIDADGKNEHHILEAIFKGFARALRFAVSRNERIKDILPTTKGMI